ncbi:MAG: glyoxalase superfamily protein [Pseudomonadota bacterium]
MTLQSVAEAKSQAKALRTALAGEGTQISHAQALEIIARQNGARDWNTLHARLARAEPRFFQIDEQVKGRYLGRDFTGRIVAVSKAGKYYDISIQLDEPIDTVRFDSFSNLRRRISGVVGADGRSPRKTSDGLPQLIVVLPAHGE